MPVVRLPATIAASFGRPRSRKVLVRTVRTDVSVSVPEYPSEDVPLVVAFEDPEGRETPFSVRRLPDGRPCREAEELPDLASLSAMSAAAGLPLLHYPEAHPVSGSRLAFEHGAPTLGEILAWDPRIGVLDPDVDRLSEAWSVVLGRSFAMVDARPWQTMGQMPVLAVSTSRRGDGAVVRVVFDLDASRRSLGPDRHHFPLLEEEAAVDLAASLVDGGRVSWEGPRPRVLDRDLAAAMSASCEDLSMDDLLARRGADLRLLAMPASELCEAAPPRHVVAAMRVLATDEGDRAEAVRILCGWGSREGARPAFAEYAEMRRRDATRVSALRQDDPRDGDDAMLVALGGI